MKFPKKSGRWILILVLLVACAFFFSGSDGFINIYKSQVKKQRMKKEIVELNRAIDSLQISIDKLTGDTTYIEKIAREKLGMAKKNEKIFKFIKEN